MKDWSRKLAWAERNARWLSAGATALLAGLVYFLTAAPAVTLEYSGVVTVAADTFGVGRVPGYPVWTILAGLFEKVVPLRYHGFPNPAGALSLFSALFGALAAGGVACLVCGSGELLFPAQGEGEIRARALHGAVAGLSAGLCFALGRVVWSQAVIVDTHSLTSFLMVLFLVLCLRWVEGWPKGFTALAFLFGLGLAATQFFIVMAPVALAVAALAGGRKAFWAWWAALLMGVVALAWGRYALRFGMGPTLLAMAGVSALFGATALFSRASRPSVRVFFLILLGLLPMLYLPIAASFNPPINWGDARTWEGFLHLISRGQFERITFTDVLSWRYASQLGAYVDLLAVQFTWPLASLGLAPFVLWPLFKGRGRAWLGGMALGFFMTSAGVTAVMNPTLDVQTQWIVRVHYMASFLYAAVFMGWGLMLLLDALHPRALWKPQAESAPATPAPPAP